MIVSATEVSVTRTLTAGTKAELENVILNTLKTKKVTNVMQELIYAMKRGMMSNAVKNIMLRAISKRLAAGEKFEDIFKSYPRLTKTEVEEIKKELEEEKKDGNC